MKFRLLFAIILTLGMAKAQGQENRGEVNKIQGFYIFADSQPIADYEVVGEVSTEGHNDSQISKSKGQYQPVRDYLIKSARKINFTADGLIMSFVTSGDDKALIIKFKGNSPTNSQSKVNQYQGLYIFTDSEPISESQYITTISDKGKSSNLQYNSFKERLIGIVKKEQPAAKAVVLKLVYGGTDTADVLKFK